MEGGGVLTGDQRDLAGLVEISTHSRHVLDAGEVTQTVLNERWALLQEVAREASVSSNST